MSPKEWLKLQLDNLAKNKNWNKSWPKATNQAPSHCVDCGRTLEKPKYKYEMLMKPMEGFPNGLISSHNGQWRVDCECGVCYLWSHPNVYRKTHINVELLMDQWENGELVRPLTVKCPQ